MNLKEIFACLEFSAKKITAAILCILFLGHQTMFVPVLASEISGITPETLPGGNHQYNIDPSQLINNTTGIRHYGTFKLTEGDIANLIFKYGAQNIENFINLVDTRIDINGIINTMRDNGFYNGHAIFVSPMGMVVGASGVLNVGSLTAIAPNPVSYLKYAGYTMGEGVMNSAADLLKKNGVLSNDAVIEIPGISDDVNLKLLKEADSNASIEVNGKIIARGDVELLAQNIKVGSKGNNAGIVAGVGNGQVSNSHGAADIKMESMNQAKNLFNALVNNEVQSGQGFGRDSKGNIIIKAQSVKQMELAAPADKLTVGAAEYAINELFDLTQQGEFKIKSDAVLAQMGLNADDVNNALQAAINAFSPNDAADPGVIGEGGDNVASVEINNAVLASNNIEVNAVSKVDYITQKGSSIFDRITNEVAGEYLDEIISGGTFNDFEGSRAKASVTIGDGAVLKANNNVGLKSLAQANTSIKIKSFLNPAVDTSSEGFYYLGSKTNSSVTVGKGSKIDADGDVNIIAASKNSLNLKIKNPTSKQDATAGTIANVPSIQVSVLKSVIEADTNAVVENGAEISAKNVNVNAVNVTSDQSNLNSVANILKPQNGNENAGIAVAVSLKDTNVNTNAEVNGKVINKNNNGQQGNVSINAQNMHVASNVSKAEVKEHGLLGGPGIKGKIQAKIAQVISKYVKGIAEGLDALTSVGNALPSASTAVVVNNSNLSATAKAGSTAKIAADNVTVNANTVDMTINNASTSVDIPKDETSQGQTSGYKPAPGVAVIVNSQNNNTQAIVDGADITANDTLKVNATTEQPMNQTTFEFALNLVQTAGDIDDLFNETGSTIFGFDASSDWDFRLLMQDLMNPANEVMFDIKNVMFDFKNSGGIGMAGLAGFFNNWAQSTSSNPTGVGLAASVVVSDVINNTIARIGDNSNVNAGNVIVNAANKVVQFNAAGDVSKLWKLKDGSTGASMGMGGTVIVESVDSKAKAQIGDGAVIKADEGVKLSSANDQDFLTVAMTGGKSTANNGIAITGTTIVQDVKGTTESSIGASTINARKLDVIAGTANISTVPTALEQLKKDPTADLDSDRFESGFEPDTNAPEIFKFTDADINLGIDSALGFADDDKTSTSTLVGSGLLQLSENSTAITDGISNMMITGALAQQTQADANQGTTSSSGVAVGASVNVSEFAREVNALIADGANITLTDSLNVAADSTTQSLNIALAGAFAGGVDMKKEPGFIDQQKEKLKNKADGYLTKLKGILGNVTSMAQASDGKTENATGSDVNNKLTDESVKNGLKDGGGLGDNLASGGKVTTTANASTAANNMSGALAGSVNAQINNSTVKAEVGNATIKVGGDVDVTAEQKTSALNIGGGVAKAGTVGAGAAVNFVQNTNNTVAQLGNSDGAGELNLTFTNNNAHNLNVNAEENNDNIQVAIGVGAAKGDKNNNSSTQVAAGGSFNTDVLKNSVSAVIDNAVINSESGDNIAVNVDAENHSTSYKGAGGMSLNIASSDSSSIGGAIGGNLNLINKTTNAAVKNSEVNNASSVNVSANKQTDSNGDLKPTEELISVGVAGSVVSGGQSAYNFQGAIGVDVINNVVSALIEDSNINSAGNVDVIAKNFVDNGNITGALGFSKTKGVGLGIGTVVDVIEAAVNAGIKNSTVAAANGNVNVTADAKEDLQFLAVNMGVTTDQTLANANAIVNVLNNTVGASVADSVLTSRDLNVLAGYDSSVEGITNADSAAVGKGNALSGNAVVNILDSTVSADITGDGKTGKKIAATGNANVKANVNQNIDIVPVGVSVSTGGTAAVAGNVGVNVISNTTSAKVEKANINSGSMKVEAKDTTTSKSRGGTVAVDGKSAAVGGSILVEILDKDIDAAVRNSAVVNTGDLTVNALAENIFGPKDTVSITADAIISAMGSGDLDDVSSLADWQMTYDLAGGAKAGVSGSLIAKVSQNQVNAAITGSDITAQDLTVKAENGIYTRNIVGNITAGGNAAVGGSMFVNVNTGNTDARIEDSVIASVGDVLVQADSIQDFKTIMVVGGAGGTAAVNGSVNSNTAKDTTTALIKNSDIKKSNSVTVKAKAKDDVESINLAAQGAGTASVGGIVYNNNYLNTVNAGIEGKKADGINSTGKVTVDAKSSESFSANIAMIGAGGTAAVNGVAIVNVISSQINSYIKNSVVNAGSTDVLANHNFNKEKYGDKTNVFTEFMDTKGTNASSDDESIAVEDKSVDSDDLAGELLPTVIVLGVSAAGTAAISANTIVDTINAQTIASVSGSEIATVDGLNIQATADEVLYNALAGVAASGTVSAGATVNTNVLSNTTKAELVNSTVETGNVNVNATQNTNLNTVLFMASGAGSGASVNGVVGVNTISNNTTATINNSKILAAENTKVSAETNVQANSIGVAGGGVGVGASVNGLTLTNVSTGSTLASIENNSVIEQGAANVSSSADTTMYNLIVGGSVAGTGGSVGVYAPVNVLNNNVNAYISDSKLNNNTTGSKVSADSDATLKTLVAVAGVAGIGGSVGASALVNVIDNDVLAYVLNSTINGGDFAIKAEQNSSLEGLVAAVQAGGLAASASVNAVTNTLNDRVKAYADNLISTANLDIDAVSTERIAYDMAALSGSGVGVTGAAIVNVISNQLEAYITNSELNGGSADIDTNQTITLDNAIIGGSVGAVAAGGGTIVNAVSNGNSAYVKDTYAEISSVSVNAQTTENITSDNIMASVSAMASGAVSALVNVLEGTTQAYIDAGSNNITADGAVAVGVSDNLTLNNLSGSAAASANGSGAASVNVNVINNALKAELLSTNEGKITADSVDVTAISNMTNNVTTSSLAGGLTAGVAGTVSVTSIGDRFSESSTVSSANADDSVKEAQNTANAAGSGLKLVQNDDGSITVADANSTGADYKNYKTPEVSLTKGTGTAKEGTVANISANVETTGGDINVKAENTVNNTVKNATGSAGAVGVGASVMVTDMNYNTVAQIQDGNITSAKNINVNSNSNITAITEALSASAGALAIGGNVAYFNNNAVTEAIIGTENTSGMNISAKDINITAESVDNISSKAIGGSAGFVNIYTVIALADTTNQINAQVLGENLNINAENLSIRAANTSDLTSEMAAAGASKYSVSALVNEASSKAVTNAIINATGTIALNNDLNVVTETGHINTTAKVALGSVAAIGVNAIEQKAESAAAFNSKINSGAQNGLKISAKNANVKAGLKKGTEEAGEINAKVEAVSAAVVLAGGTATIMKAIASATSEASIKNTTLEAKENVALENVALKSSLNRNASSSSAELNISGIGIGATFLDTIAAGSSIIDTAGANIATNSFDAAINSTNSADTGMLAGEISLISGSGYDLSAASQSSAQIKLGDITADEKISANIQNNKTATTNSKSGSVSLANVGATIIDTTVSGDSTIDTSAGTLTSEHVGINLTDNAAATTESMTGSISLIKGNGMKASSTVNSNSNIKTGSMNADNITVALNNTKTSKVTDSSVGGGVVSIGASDIDSTAGGKSGIQTSGTVKGFDGKGSASSFNITVKDDSSAENTASNANYGLIGASVINIDSTVSSTIENLIAGDIHANNIKIQSDLNRTSTANGTAASAGLSGISSINMNSTIGANKTTANGAVTTITATIADALGSIDIDSNATNTAKTYVADSTAGLIAIAKGEANNNLNSVNTVNMQGANIDIDGTFDVSAQNTNDIAMTKRSSGGGFIAIKGGEMQNNINATANINIKDSNINAGNMKIASKSKFGSIGTIQYDDSADGFITKSGAIIKNTIKQHNNVTIDNSTLTADGDLSVSQQSDSDFHQEVKSVHSAGLSYNRAESRLDVTNENIMNIINGTSIAANDVTINMDSNNNLSSKTHTEARHFAGNPKSWAYLNLTNKNHMTNDGTITSKGSTKVNFLSNSKNTLTQDAYLYAEASIATGDKEGSLTYKTDNKLDVQNNGVIASDKDVIVNFGKGSNNFSAKNHSVKVSRLLFGIPITSRDTEYNKTEQYNNALNLDGEISAGIGSQKYMQIDKDGKIVKDSLKGFSDNDYKLGKAQTQTSEEVTKQAIQSIEAQKDYIESQIAELKENKDANQEKIDYYNEQISELKQIIDNYKNANKISESDVSNAIENNIKNNIVSSAGSGTDGSTLPSDAYETIKNSQNSKVTAAQQAYEAILNDPEKTQAEKDAAYKNYQDSVDSALEKALDEYEYKYTYQWTETDSEGGTVSKSEERETKLSTSQKNNIIALVEKEQAKYTHDENGFSVYDGKIVDNDSFNSAISNLEKQKGELNTNKQNFVNSNSSIENKTTELNKKIKAYDNQIKNLKENPLDAIEMTNSYIQFDDIITQQPKIEITGITKANVTGDGKFKVYQPGLTVDNYSNRDLIFNVVNLAARENAGLTIGGERFDSYLDTGRPIADNVLYITERNHGEIKDDTISINNYFDHNNPLLYGKLPSDIIFNNIVNAAGKIDILNESGDITFKNAVTSNQKDIIASQGNILYDNANTDFSLNDKNDRLIAGQNITINAKNIQNNGTIQAGRDVRNITITDDMLNNLVYDPTTGKTNLISLGGSDKSAYLNDNGNNIKAIYEGGKIKLFITSQEGGNVDLNGTVSGSGTVSYTNGYSDIQITNNTDKTLVINNFENNKMNGTVDNAGTLKVNKLGKDAALTSIISKGKIETAGVIQNGKDDANNPSENSLLALESENGIVINNLKDELGKQINTIDSIGKLNINNKTNSSVLIDGAIQNDGNIEIKNSGTDGLLVSETAVINNKNGNIVLNNTAAKLSVEGVINNTASGDVILTASGSDGLEIAKSAQINNNIGNVSVENGDGDLLIAGKVNNKKGDSSFTNNGTNTTISGTIKNETGNTSVTNKNGELTLTQTGKISNKVGSTTLNNEGTNTTVAGVISNEGNNISITNAIGELLVSGEMTNIGKDTILTNNGTNTTISGTIVNETGNTFITNKGGQLFVSGTTTNTGGNTSVTNNGEGGIVFDTTAVVSNSGEAGKLTVTNTAGGVKVAENAKITNDSKTAEDNLILANSGSGLIEIFGHLFNKNEGNTVISNTNTQSGINVGVKTNTDNSAITNRGTVENTDGELKITNNGSQGIQITGDVVNKKGNTSINNTAGGVNIGTVITTANGKTTVNKGTVTNNNGAMTVSNRGDNGVRVAGDVTNNNGKLTVDNKKGAVIIDRTNGVKGRLENTFNGSGETMLVQNTGKGGININGDVLNNGTGTLNVLNNNEADSSILVTAGSLVQNEQGGLNMTNKGGSGIDIAGEVYNKNGTLALDNQNTSAGIIIESTGRVHNDRGGNILVNNIGSGNTIVQGIVTALQNEIDIINSNSDVIIGDNTDNDNYINAVNNNVNITVNNGNLLNSGVDKTLIKSGKDLNISVKDGDIGMTEKALEGKKPGFSINASTRDKTESVNINAGGVITASAENETKTGDRLINLTAKDSDMKINQVKADGNVMLTAAEWDTEDRNPTPGEYDEEDYFTGYSIINAAKDKTQPNVTGKNISLISSNNIGSADNYFTYQQTGTAEDYFSAESENDLYVQGMGDKTNIWQLITKRGNMGLVFDGNTTIRELTAGKDIQIVNKGQNLTIYDLGRLPHILNPADDLLYPHDRIELSSVVPETVNIAVLDAKGGDDAYSTLNIYNAFVRGTDDDKADVVLAADRIIAHASEAPDSIVSNAARPDGFDASEGRDYYDDPSDTNSEILQATGFNTSGAGSQLTFDITGVSPEIVAAVNEEVSGRDYNSQDVVQTIHIFNNDYGFTETVYKANDVTLSLNSASSSPTDNRGALFNTFYTDNAYVDTKDLNLDMKDAFVTNYGEFRNGSRGGDAGAHEIGGGYRWLTIVDNDYQRNISSLYGINLTTQLYTKLTGSYALHMGNTIDQRTKAPVVYYNPYEVVNLPRTENSFYRLTFKDDKIQKTTTTPEFEDIDKDTYKPTKRQNIRFSLAKDDEEVKVANKRIISILDISKGGLAVEHDGTLQKGEEFMINLSYHNITATPEVRVVRVSGNKAGLQFINMDNATANKILYINLFAAQDNTDQTSSSKATMVIEKL